MDFFERQDRARRSTKWLVLYFLAGITLVVLAVYAALLAAGTGIGLAHPRAIRYFDNGQFIWWHPRLFLGVVASTLAMIGIGCLSKTHELAGGGCTVAAMLGGRLINPNTNDPAERRLLNVVEEMAIASGIPVPQVFLLPNEHGINAFAAGHSTSDAVVTVTAGALQLLTRDELQGVIGHEFSHILNGDMALNMRLIGAVFGIMCLTIIGRVLLQAQPRSSSRRDRGGIVYLAILGLALIVIGWIGAFFGRLIQAAVSRQREFLADASAVQFTRNPAGLSSALQKIGRYSFGSHIEAPQAEQASHLFFSSGVSESFFGLLATHPPIPDRIRAIDPSWDGTFPPLTKEQMPVVEAAALAELAGHTSALGGVNTTVEQARDLLFSDLDEPPHDRCQPNRSVFPAPVSTTPRSVAVFAGNLTPAHLRYAENIAIPDSVRADVRDPLGASAVIYALLLSQDEAVRSRQLAELGGATSDAVVAETTRTLPDIQDLATHARLPLVDLALPGLRHLSPEQFGQFRDAVQKLVEADGQIDLFEYVLQKIALRHLEPQFSGAKKALVQYYSLKALVPDCEVLLSQVAYVGQEDADQIQAAFQNGAGLLENIAQVELHLLPRTDCDLARVDASLDRLGQAVPQIKKNVLDACARVVAADGVIQEMEAELLRGIADTLDSPLPPFVPEDRAG